MKINHKILSLPPYISTSWSNVLSLHLEAKVEGHLLIVGLLNGSTIEVPGLDSAILQAIFAAHEKHLDQEVALRPMLPQGSPSMGDSTVIGIPLSLGIEGLQQMGSIMQHNPEAALSPDLPPEVLEKIGSFAKVLGFDESSTIAPKPEPHCNCTHCQIARAMQSGNEQKNGKEELAEQEEELVSATDLKFRDWEISQVSDKLYHVTNPLNSLEQYTVFLGLPIGCTCGDKNCQHIRAVLTT